MILSLKKLRKDVGICKISGKPITKTNSYGMFCEDLCGLEEEKRAYELTKKFINKIIPFLGEKC